MSFPPSYSLTPRPSAEVILRRSPLVVSFRSVDLDQGTVSGLLQIQHLTPELESLVTFFE